MSIGSSPSCAPCSLDGAVRPLHRSTMADDEVLLDERRGPIRLFTLNRPAQRNALSADLIRRLRAALTDADRDEGAHVVCLTGAGERAFCAGADLGAVAPDSVDLHSFARRRSSE